MTALKDVEWNWLSCWADRGASFMDNANLAVNQEESCLQSLRLEYAAPVIDVFADVEVQGGTDGPVESGGHSGFLTS